MNRIVITKCPLHTNISEVFSMAKEDEKLINAITEYRDFLHVEGIETFDQKLNIIATEKGYYFAFWEDDLTIV